MTASAQQRSSAARLFVLSAALAVLTALTATLTACTTTVPATHYYRITASPAASSQATQPAQYALLVRPVGIPLAIDRQQFVVQKSATESAVLDEHRWVAPLEDQFTQALVTNLRARLPNAWVAKIGELDPSLKRYTLQAQIDLLSIALGDAVRLDATWLVLDANKKVVQRSAQTFTVKLNNAGYDAVAPAVSQAVQELAAVIAKSM